MVRELWIPDWEMGRGPGHREGVVGQQGEFRNVPSMRLILLPFHFVSVSCPSKHSPAVLQFLDLSPPPLVLKLTSHVYDSPSKLAFHVGKETKHFASQETFRPQCLPTPFFSNECATSYRWRTRVALLSLGRLKSGMPRLIEKSKMNHLQEDYREWVFLSRKIMCELSLWELGHLDRGGQDQGGIVLDSLCPCPWERKGGPRSHGHLVMPSLLPFALWEEEDSNVEVG